MSFLKSLANLGVGIVSAILLVVAVVVMSATRAFRSGMIDIKPELFIQMAATVFAIIALWYLLTGNRVVATRLGITALAGFLLANVPLKFPGTWHLGEANISEADRANARTAEALEVAHVVPGTPPYFTKEGHPRYYWSPADSPPVFYDRAGIHPDDASPLRPVDSLEIATMILRQQRLHAEALKAAEALQTLQRIAATPQPTPGPPPGPAPGVGSEMLISEPQIVSARQPTQYISAQPTPQPSPQPEKR